MTVTVLPGSAFPLTLVSPGFTGFTTGASGDTLSGTTTTVGLLMLPAGSVVVTTSLSPGFNGVTGTFQLPSLSTGVLISFPFG